MSTARDRLVEFICQHFDDSDYWLAHRSEMLDELFQYEGWFDARAALVAEVGTLRARVAELECELCCQVTP